MALEVTMRYEMHAQEKSKEGTDYLYDGGREMDKEKCKRCLIITRI